jgi:hypothetical protein
MALSRVCGGAWRVTAGSTRQQLMPSVSALRSPNAMSLEVLRMIKVEELERAVASLVAPQLTVVPAPPLNKTFKRMRGTSTVLG